VLARLIEGEPRVAMLVTDCGLTLSPNNLEPGEEELVARRLREVLAAR